MSFINAYIVIELIMKKHLLLIFSVSLFFKSFVQQRYFTQEIPINKKEFNRHLPPYNFLTKSLRIFKTKGTIKIKTPKRTITLTDDGEMLQYRYEGDLRNTPLILIHELEPNSEEYYFINRHTGTIDTLLDRPIFYLNGTDIVCLEGSATDRKQRIQIGKIQNGRFATKAYFVLSEGIYPDYVYWFDNNTLYMEDNTKKFYKLQF